MQQTRLPKGKEAESAESRAKGQRRLHPTSEFYEGKRKYANALGQEFFAKTIPDGKPGSYFIEVFQLGEGKPITRFSAALRLMGKALKIEFMERTSWGALPKYRGIAPSGYGAAKVILDEAISLAQKLGAKSIYLEAAHFKLFAYYQSFGFREVEGTNHMQLEVPGK